MAKTTGPLFSLAASGTVGKLISFRMGKSGPEVTKKPHPKTQPSAQQAIERQRMKDARAGFLTLSVEDLGYWQELATVKSRPVWLVFFQEWQIQQVVAGQMPLIPDATL
jgi:hypothetical protein